MALVLVRTAGAQTASINGTVTDPSAALVEHAKVTATNTAINISRTTQTGSAGVYIHCAHARPLRGVDRDIPNSTRRGL